MLSKTYTKYIQSLHHRKGRDAANSFIAEGHKVVLELLQSGRFNCQHVLAKEDWFKENESTIRGNYKGSMEVIEDHELHKISALATPNNVLAVFEMAKMPEPVLKEQVTLVLDTIQDPGNLGTIIRIADWFGVPDIICSENSVELYNPKVVQSTMGSIGKVNVIYTNLYKWLQENHHIKVYAATLNGKNINEMNAIKEGIIMIGNESKGISPELIALAHEKITIPKKGQAESLNAAVAAGIILSHIA